MHCYIYYIVCKDDEDDDINNLCNKWFLTIISARSHSDYLIEARKFEKCIQFCKY